MQSLHWPSELFLPWEKDGDIHETYFDSSSIADNAQKNNKMSTGAGSWDKLACKGKQTSAHAADQNITPCFVEVFRDYQFL